jgi:hypothetical protein
MLQRAMAGPGARFALFVHHDDAAREFAYDRTDRLQKFNVGWDEAVSKGSGLRYRHPTSAPPQPKSA